MDDYEDIMNDFGINNKSDTDSVEKPKDDDMKDENVTVNSSNVEFLQRRLKAQALLVTDLRQKTQSLTEKLKQSKRHSRLLTDQLEELQNISNVQQDDVINENIQLKQEVNEWKVKHEDEQKENEQLKIDISTLQDENEQFKMKSLDPTKYKQWTPNDVYLYLMSISDGLLKQYQNDIKAFIADSQVKGTDLKTFSMSDWNDCGIKTFADRKSVIEVIKVLGDSSVDVNAVDDEPGNTPNVQ